MLLKYVNAFYRVVDDRVQKQINGNLNFLNDVDLKILGLRVFKYGNWGINLV